MKLSTLEAAMFCFANVLLFGSLLIISVHFPYSVQHHAVKFGLAGATASLVQFLLVLVWPARR